MTAENFQRNHRMPLFCVYEENGKPNYIILDRNCITLEIVYIENILATISRLFEWPDHLVKVFIIHGASQVVLMVKNPLANAGDRCGFDSLVRKIPWRRVWQPTPVFLPGESHRQRSLGGYSPWGNKESDMTEVP